MPAGCLWPDWERHRARVEGSSVSTHDMAERTSFSTRHQPEWIDGACEMARITLWPSRRRTTVNSPAPVLSIENLSIGLPALADRPHAIKGLSLSINPGETLCVVGESGSGKSMTAMATIGLLPGGVEVLSGTIRLGGRDLLALDETGWCDVRGREVGTVFQEPMTSLNPVMRVADQISETFRAHGLLTPAERDRRVLDLLTEVHLPHPELIARAYPHELSGGQRQRVM